VRVCVETRSARTSTSGRKRQEGPGPTAQVLVADFTDDIGGNAAGSEGSATESEGCKAFATVCHRRPRPPDTAHLHRLHEHARERTHNTLTHERQVWSKLCVVQIYALLAMVASATLPERGGLLQRAHISSASSVQSAAGERWMLCLHVLTLTTPSPKRRHLAAAHALRHRAAHLAPRGAALRTRAYHFAATHIPHPRAAQASEQAQRVAARAQQVAARSLGAFSCSVLLCSAALLCCSALLLCCSAAGEGRGRC
jgi:hypothetical protein